MKTQALYIHAENDLRLEDAEVPATGTTEVRVRIVAGGICGSDLHYYQHGGFGTVRLREPMILGHEVAGRVEEVGSEVTRVRVGDLVAINPSRPCHDCEYCDRGMYNHCLNMRFYGSAMPYPHIQGAFRRTLIAHESQCFAFPDSLSPVRAATAEPLAVILHAARQFGELKDRDILITGCGPIGALAVLVAKAHGAHRIVVTDVADEPLAVAAKLGADRCINVARAPDELTEDVSDHRPFDGLFEASGNGRALAQAIECLQPGARMVQIGLGGEMTLPMNRIVARELELRGTFRFHEEFGDAVQHLAAGTIDVQPLLTARFPLDRAREAFELAGDRSRAMKVQLTFED